MVSNYIRCCRWAFRIRSDIIRISTTDYQAISLRDGPPGRAYLPGQTLQAIALRNGPPGRGLYITGVASNCSARYPQSISR
jgi:hypothetical protein